MFVEPVVEDEVASIIKSLKISSAGWDSISACVVKTTYDAFLTPLTHVMNLSVTTGVFPNELKVARVIPIFKSGDATSFSNYRPVSVLPLFSKILESLMFKRLISFVNEYGLLYQHQFGFRTYHSPNLALIYLIDKVSNALEDGDYVLGLFLDFSKAFDTVNHDILLSKLEHYGVRGVPLNWFKSYLCGRQQFVEYQSVCSNQRTITCGVPQGSILGPLLFLLYINDLAHVSSKIFFLLFADDSNLFLSGKNPNDLIKTMNAEIANVVDWLRINKLSLNLKKTHFMLFRRRRAKMLLDNDVIIDGVTISIAEKTKFLGDMIDPFLTFAAHVQYIRGKVAKGIGILYKCKKYFNRNTLLTLYCAFIYPYLNYCNCIWENTYQSYLDPLIKLQKRAVRTICGTERNAHTECLFGELKVLNMSKLYVYCVQLFLFKYHHKQVPETFDEFYTLNRDVHTYFTRQSALFHTTGATTSQKCKTIRVAGVNIYNYFYQILDMNCSFITYKKNLKYHLLDNDVDQIKWHAHVLTFPWSRFLILTYYADISLPWWWSMVSSAHVLEMPWFTIGTAICSVPYVWLLSIIRTCHYRLISSLGGTPNVIH